MFSICEKTAPNANLQVRNLCIFAFARKSYYLEPWASGSSWDVKQSLEYEERSLLSIPFFATICNIFWNFTFFHFNQSIGNLTSIKIQIEPDVIAFSVELSNSIAYTLLYVYNKWKQTHNNCYLTLLVFSSLFEHFWLSAQFLSFFLFTNTFDTRVYLLVCSTSE